MEQVQNYYYSGCVFLFIICFSLIAGLPDNVEQNQIEMQDLKKDAPVHYHRSTLV